MDLQESITVTKKNLGAKHKIDFALTTYCQARCRSCARTNEYTGDKESWLDLKHMDLNIFKQTLAASPNLQFSSIEFCGEFGDPMMHPQIDDFISTAFEFTKKVIISTNGALRNKEWYTHIGNKYKRELEINFAIDGTTHETNWKYREGVNWQKSMDNMSAFSKAGGYAIWNFIIFEWNWQQIPTMRKIANEINVKTFIRYNNRPHGLITKQSKLKADKLL